MLSLRIFSTFILLSLAGLNPGAAGDAALDRLKQAYKRPNTIPFPKSAPYSPQMAMLGKMLFFDPRVSGAQNLGCNACHDPSFGYEVPIPGPIGAANTPLGRKAPTILNAAYTPVFFWDGRAKSLEDQAKGPITADAEMGANFPDLIGRLGKVPEYDKWFKRLFPKTGMTAESITTAIATFERTVVANSAPFDRWVEGEENAVSESAKRGFILFNGKANCSACHTGWNFTDNQFHDIGLPSDDIGRGKYEPNNILAQHAFKTPGLRNLTYRAPFGHDGSEPDLASIVAFYQTGGITRPSLSPLMKPFSLNEQETTDLLNFLQSLTAVKTETALPNLPN